MIGSEGQGVAGDMTEAVRPYMTLSIEESDRLLRRYAAILGLLAFMIPFVVPLSAWLLSLRDGGFCMRDSLSHFYYSPIGGNIFVALLALIVGALVFYRGENRVEGWLANLAALAMAFVALFPAGGHGCHPASETAAERHMQSRSVVDLSWDNRAWGLSDNQVASLFFDETGPISMVHYGAATVLFSILAMFCLFIFTRVRRVELGYPADMVDVDNAGNVLEAKLRRNRLYRIAGVVILMSMAALFAKLAFGKNWTFWNEGNLTFWFEALALATFGLSWLLKGRFFTGLLESHPESASS